MKRRVWLALPAIFVIFYAVNISAQQQICCKCKGQSGPFGTPAPAGYDPSDVCPNACTTNGGGWTGESTEGSCNATPHPVTPPPPPEKSFDGKVVDSVRWAICHQGAKVFERGGIPLLKGKALLDAVVGAMGAGDDAQRLYVEYEKNDHDISGFVAKGIESCKAEFPEADMIQHMYWVCVHEKKSFFIRRHLEQGDWNGVRDTFSDNQPDDRYKNVLFAYNADELTRIEQAGCPAL